MIKLQNVEESEGVFKNDSKPGELKIHIRFDPHWVTHTSGLEQAKLSKWQPRFHFCKLGLFYLFYNINCWERIYIDF